ncbi:Chain length determinant protein [Chitinophaga sp. 180180018-2]|nr:Chain length determinant protein [Chitinophaga sp. 212800010-3]
MEQGKEQATDKGGADEISLKELIIKIQEWSRFFWKKKFLILGITCLGAVLGLLSALRSKPQYVADLTFVLEDNSSSPLGAYSGLASQFGIDLNNGSGGSLFAGDNIMEFLKTRLIVERALLSPVQYQNKQMTLAECFIRFSNLRKAWSKQKKPFDVQFPLNEKRSAFTLDQDSVLNAIRKIIVKNNLKVEKVDKKLSFISVEVVSPVDTFSLRMTEALVKEAIDFYIDTKTQKTKANVDRLQLQADSMRILLDRKTYSAASVQDLNVNPAKQVASVGTELALRDKVVLQTLYGEVVKNLELSKIAMAREMPVIQIIDRPILPLEIKKLGELKGIVIGAILGGFLTSLTLLFYRIYKEIMS